MVISYLLPYTPDTPVDISVPHYVRGRTLTSEDLQQERDATRKHLAFIARAAGTGIVEGLWVEKSDSADGLTLKISKGLGINTVGDAVSLTKDVTISLIPIPNTAPVANTLLKVPSFDPCAAQNVTVSPAASKNVRSAQIAFSPCDQSTTINLSSLPDGPYVLTAVPLYRRSDELVTVQKAAGLIKNYDCTNKWDEEILNFRAIYLGKQLIFNGFDEATDTDHRRNLLAHWVYGTAQLLALTSDPFRRLSNLDYGGFDIARNSFQKNNDLTDNDLHLAIFYLETNAKTHQQSILFVDNWSVRRRPSHPSPSPTTSLVSTAKNGVMGWSQHLNDRLAAEGQARFAQFQEQLDALRKTSSVGNWSANKYFRYLPSAGYVPLIVSDMLRQVIAQFVTDFFLEEVKKYSATANPIGSQLFWNTPVLVSLVSVGGNAHTYDTQMNDLIAQVNTILGDILNAGNALALNQSITPISFEPIPYMRTTEIDASTSHVLLAAFNNRIRTTINTRLIQLANLINQIGINYSVTIPVPAPIGTISGASDNSLHISFSTLNTDYIPLANARIAQLVNALNLIAGNPSFVINPFFKKVREELSGLLKTALVQVLTPNTNGVQLDTFFFHDILPGSTLNNIVQSLANQQSPNNILGPSGIVISKDVKGSSDVLPAPKLSYMKNIAFTDRQSIEQLLETSYLAPAIDLSTNQNLSLVMVYEDVIPYAAERLKNIIESSLFTVNRDNLRKIWYAGIQTTFDNIIALRSKIDTDTPPHSPPLYGLFTQAIYPLQLSIWQQGNVLVVPLPVSDTDQQTGNDNIPDTGNTGGDDIEQPPEGDLN